MLRTTFRRPKQKRPRAALSVDARAMIEGHLRDLAQSGRLSELPCTRNALVRHCREQGDDTAVYCLAGASDFSLGVTPAGGVLLTVRRTGDLLWWSREDLLKKGPEAETEIENRATELAGGPKRFGDLSPDEREALKTQAVQDLIVRPQGPLVPAGDPARRLELQGGQPIG